MALYLTPPLGTWSPEFLQEQISLASLDRSPNLLLTWLPGTTSVCPWEGSYCRSDAQGNHGHDRGKTSGDGPPHSPPPVTPTTFPSPVSTRSDVDPDTRGGSFWAVSVAEGRSGASSPTQ